MPIARFSDNRYYLNYTVTSGTQSIPNNTTVVTSFLQIVKDGSASGWSNNTSYWYTGYPSSTSGTFTYNFGGTTTKTLYNNGQHTIGHNADGTKQFSTSASVNADTPLGSASIGSFNVTLPTIPRASTPTVTGGSLTTGVSSEIKSNRASSAFTHTLSYSIGGKSGTIKTDMGENQNWTPPHDLLTELPNATSRILTLTLVTKNGTNTIGTKSIEVTLNANASQVPTVGTVSWADKNTALNSGIGASVYVQGRSIMQATFTSSSVHGATTPENLKKITIAGVTYNYGAQIPIQTDGNVVATASATDTRGRTTTRSANFTVLPYSPPKLGSGGYSVSRANSSYNADPTGTYAIVNLHVTATSLKPSTTELNAQTIVISTKQRGTSDWVVRKTVPGALSHNGKINIDGAQGGPIFTGDKSYDFKIEVYDKTEPYPPPSNERTSVHVEEVLSTTKVALDIYGSKLGVGKMNENGTLDVLGDTYTTGNFYAGSTKKLVLLKGGVAGSDISSGTIPAARIPQATTGARGGALIASQAEVNAKTNNAKYVTPLTLAGRDTLLKPTSLTVDGGAAVIDANGTVRITTNGTKAISLNGMFVQGGMYKIGYVFLTTGNDNIAYRVRTNGVDFQTAGKYVLQGIYLSGAWTGTTGTASGWGELGNGGRLSVNGGSRAHGEINLSVSPHDGAVFLTTQGVSRQGSTSTQFRSTLDVVPESIIDGITFFTASTFTLGTYIQVWRMG